MGLFDDAKNYGGSFYRSFSQSHGSSDLELYFPNDPVIQQGICAGSSFDWLEHYLNFPEVNYSNEIMQHHSKKILAIQRALRFRDQSLSDLLIMCGMKPHNHLPFKYKFTENNSKEVAQLSAFISGANVISYTDPEQGKHVAVFYVDQNKNLFFMDTQKGDVSIPYPGSCEWLERYFLLFTKKCGEIEISHFQPVWNPQQAEQAFRSIARDAISYTPPTYSFANKVRPADDQTVVAPTKTEINNRR